MDTVTYEYTLEDDLIRILVDSAIESPTHAMIPEHQVFIYSMPKQLDAPIKEDGKSRIDIHWGSHSLPDDVDAIRNNDESQQEV